MAEVGTIVIEFDRDLREPVARHVLDLISETLHPFNARVISHDLPVEPLPPRNYKRPEIRG